MLFLNIFCNNLSLEFYETFFYLNQWFFEDCLVAVALRGGASHRSIELCLALHTLLQVHESSSARTVETEWFRWLCNEGHQNCFGWKVIWNYKRVDIQVLTSFECTIQEGRLFRDQDESGIWTQVKLSVLYFVYYSLLHSVLPWNPYNLITLSNGKLANTGKRWCVVLNNSTWKTCLEITRSSGWRIISKKHPWIKRARLFPYTHCTKISGNSPVWIRQNQIILVHWWQELFRMLSESVMTLQGKFQISSLLNKFTCRQYQADSYFSYQEGWLCWNKNQGNVNTKVSFRNISSIGIKNICVIIITLSKAFKSIKPSEKYEKFDVRFKREVSQLAFNEKYSITLCYLLSII